MRAALNMLTTPLDVLEQRLGFDPLEPCFACGCPVEQLSVGGPRMCPWCDCGRHRDGRKHSLNESLRHLRLPYLQENLCP